MMTASASTCSKLLRGGVAKIRARTKPGLLPVLGGPQARVIPLGVCRSSSSRSSVLSQSATVTVTATATATPSPVVTTYRRCQIRTASLSHRIPLSIVDLHLRHEQLPFGYFFDETLDERALEESLQTILPDFPQLGGRICPSTHLAIQCHPDDTVQLSFGRINMTLDEWQRQQRGHTLQGSRNPILLPLFDSLLEPQPQDSNHHPTSNPQQQPNNNPSSPLVKIRVTYFQHKGTAIAVNFCHALGDTATCVHFVQSWGKHMRQKHYPPPDFDRSKACLSGMMTRDIADIMGLVATVDTTTQRVVVTTDGTGLHNNNNHNNYNHNNNSDYLYAAFLPARLRNWLFGFGGTGTAAAAAAAPPLSPALPGTGTIPPEVLIASDIPIVADIPVPLLAVEQLQLKAMTDIPAPLAPVEQLEDLAPNMESQTAGNIRHEYVRLPFPPNVLQQLKDLGTFSCLEDNNSNNNSDDDGTASGSSFVSTNDMVTAFGWLMKRHLSENVGHSISMVVNLRGRSGVNPTMFGNGITHVVATLPQTDYTSNSTEEGCSIADSSTAAFRDTLCQAAKAIRSALQVGLSDIPNALSMSQMGTPLPSPANSTQSFSTTSWGQFPLYKVRFGESPMSHFHGHPAHPLPKGRTFASVITPSPDGGCFYEMLVPSDRADQARTMHAEMVAMVMAWSPSSSSSSSQPLAAAAAASPATNPIQSAPGLPLPFTTSSSRIMPHHSMLPQSLLAARTCTGAPRNLYTISGRRTPDTTCSSSSCMMVVRSSSSSATTSTRTRTTVRRRKRPSYGKAKPEGTGPPKKLPERTGLDAPYAFGGPTTTTNEYLEKTSLSPWVPLPDPIARKLFDMSAPTPEDIHVDLGCGDGRVNFYAIDHGKVQRSIGIDIDEGILAKAQERLEKRHPQPPMEFVEADLLDYHNSNNNNNNDVWNKIQKATIITMYFVDDALQKIRPILEEKLAGKRCRIITCGYEMKGWNFSVMETTLGMTVYLYHWNNDGTNTEDHSDNDGDTPFFDDEILAEKPRELSEDPLDQLRARGGGAQVKHVDSTKLWSLLPDPHKPDPGDSWSDDDDEEEEGDEMQVDTEPRPAKPKPTRKKTPCSRS